MTEHFDAIVIGAGAAGLMAGTQAALGGLKTLILEKNQRAGVKILMSGGTRCNLTHATDQRNRRSFPPPTRRFLAVRLGCSNAGSDDRVVRIGGRSYQDRRNRQGLSGHRSSG